MKLPFIENPKRRVIFEVEYARQIFFKSRCPGYCCGVARDKNLLVDGERVVGEFNGAAFEYKLHRRVVNQADY